jgi:hypothetical protein
VNRRLQPRSRFFAPLCAGIALAITTWVAATLLIGLMAIGPTYLGLDIQHYLHATQRWLDTGSPYLPSEVAGPFEYQPETFLHPPISMLLFAPFLVLPLPLWWAPLPLAAWCIYAWRPAPWTWPIMAALVALPPHHISIIVGNSDMWILAAIALGLRFGWPALLIVVKPSLFPFLLAGVRHRSFWLAIPVVALLCVPFGLLWIDWVKVLLHAPGSLFYSLGAVTLMAVPVVAYVGRTAGRVQEAGSAGVMQARPVEDPSRP